MTVENDLLAAIAAARRNRQRRESHQKKACTMLLIALALGIIGIAWSLHFPHHDAIATEQIASFSSEEIRGSSEEAQVNPVDPRDEFADIDWEYWLDVNPDIVGWMTIDGTRIDYPIVKARKADPSFYLSHDMKRNADAKGCIFLDAECEAGLESMHSVIYGHNWNGGLMFADLAKYADSEFARSHPCILMQTPDWKECLEIQCVEVANGTDDSNVIAFSDEGEMALWFQERFQASIIQMDAEPKKLEGLNRIYTFCTCADGPDDKRVLVYAMPSMNLRAASRDSASTA